MSTSFERILDAAELALASYSDFSSIPRAATGELSRARVKEELIRLKGIPFFLEKESDFSNTQADRLLERFDVVDQHTENTYTNGFSATVFRDRIDGQLYFVNRGTDDIFSDGVVTDSTLALAGKPLLQIVSMVNYYLRVQAGGDRWAVQVDVDPLSFATGPVGFRLGTAVVGVGAGTGTAPIVVAGHSLGGYLSTIFGYLFGATTDSVFTYNAPGSWGVEGAMRNLARVLGNSNPGYAEDRQANLIGDYVVSAVPGHRGTDVRIFEEGNAHSQKVLTDSLALYNLVAKLDPSLTPRAIGVLFNACAAVEGDSLEQTLDSLRRVILGLSTVPTKAAGSPDSQVSREAFYNNLYSLMASPGLVALTGNVRLELLSGKAVDVLVDAAMSGHDALAYRYALKAGNPYALLGALGLYDQHNHNGELERYDPVTGQGEMTEQYIRERAQMLVYWVKHNLTDGQRNVDPTIAGFSRLYRDLEKGIELLVDRTANTTSPGMVRPMVVFGGSGAEMLSGEADHDDLYGGAGNDTLAGAAGHDYLEGNAGADSLDGGTGNDRLLGGVDDDILTGGRDADWLYGGKGLDRYRFTAGDGLDVIDDFDGNGLINIDGTVLAGGKPAGPNLWLSPDKSVRYALADQGDGTRTLNILYGGDRIQVLRFTDGVLGIHLAGADPAPPPPPPDRLILGDFQPLAPPGIDDLGNPVLTATPAPGRADALQDGSGNDSVVAGGGDDAVSALHGGDDRIDAGDGSDVVSAGAGADWVAGGNGPDVLGGGAGDDRLFARGEVDFSAAVVAGDTQAPSPGKGDFLDGGDGSDTLVGDAGPDALLGGVGGDLISGGGGDDFLAGDGQAAGVGRSWAATRTVEGDRYTWTAVGFSVTGSAGGNDILAGGAGADWIFAGAGDDWAEGGPDADVVFGEAGADEIFGGAGNDVLSGDAALAQLPAELHGTDFAEGGAGDDTLFGGQGSDNLLGGAGNDQLQGDYGDDLAGEDWLDGGDGNDTVIGFAGTDQLFGGDGADLLVGDGVGVSAAGADTLDGGAGDDELQGGGGDDSLAGGDGNDALFGDEGNDSLAGGVGNDQLAGDAGGDLLDGGSGNDIAQGGAGDDLLDGGTGNDELQGGEGSDSLAGGEGDDLLSGAAGDDLLDGGAGNDQLEAGGGLDTLAGGAGTDTLFDLAGGATTYLFQPGDGWDQVRDAGGANRLDFSGFALGGIEVGHTGDGSTLVLDLGGGDRIDIVDGFLGAVQTFALAGGTVSLAGFLDANLPAGVGITGAGNLTGGAGADTLTATASSTLYGGRGDDALVGLAGGNTILTDPASGQDSLRVAGTDNIVVLAGATLLDLAPSWGRSDPLDLVVGLAGNRSLTVLGGAAGSVAEWRFDDGALTHAQLLARLPALAMGTAGHDSLTGTAGADWLAGLAGNDTLVGLAGNDVLDGGSGADRLVGGPGDDRYFVDSGTDAVVEESGEGIDSIRAATSYLVPPNVEHLVLEGSGPYFTTGNALDNELVGNGAGNALSGRGGNDTLLGLAGNDSLSGGDGTDALSGGDGNDTLDGNAGADRLEGGAGNDVYAVDAAGDVVVEADGEGTDRVTSAVDFTLPGGIEHLTLSGTAFQGTGNDLDNALTGNAVANLLSGAGGNDTLSGGAGNDTLDGGPGADWLAGDAGDDTYLVRSGEGGKRITESAGYGTDTVVFDVPRDAAVVALGADLRSVTVRLVATGETIEISADTVEYLRFTDATVAAASIAVVIEGGTEADAITGTARSDSILGWGGDDSLYGSGGQDSLDGGTGDDRLSGNDGDDSLVGGEGNDTLDGGYGFNRLAGGPGNDELRGGDDMDLLDGGPGDDTLYGGDGNDTLAGGGGRDVLWGGLGSDTYDYRAGDGLVTLRDATMLGHGAFFGDRPGRQDVLVVAADAGHGTRYLAGPFATPTLVLSGRAGDTLRFETADLVWGRDPVVNEIRFLADAGVWSAGSSFAPGSYTRVMTDTVIGGTDLADILASVPGMSTTFVGGAGADLYRIANPADRVSDSGNDGSLDRVEASVDFAVEPGIEELALTGTAVSGRGNAGDNLIVGNARDNLLAGGGGNDTLQGGEGGDTYVVDAADRSGSTSRIVESAADAGRDVLRFTGGIGPADVGLVRRGDDLLFVTPRQRIAVADAFLAPGPLLEAVAFSDGTVWDGDGLAARARGAPVLNLPLPDREVDEDVLSEFLVDPASFTAASGAGSLTYSASLGDGSPLPDWLSFDPRRVRFSALPFDGEAGGAWTVRLTARDAAGNAGWETFALTVRGTNDAPRIVAPLPVQEVAGGYPAEIQLLDAFSDPDDDVLAIGIRLADGSPLPSWATLDPARPGVLAISDSAAEGVHALQVTATDGFGAAASESVNLVVRYGAEPSLVVCPSGEQRVAEDSAFFFNCDPSPDLALEPGERLRVSVRRLDGGPLPAWLALDPTQTYGSGTPGNADVGKVDLVVTATLAARGEVQTSYLSVIVENTPDAPVLAAPLPDVRLDQGAAWDWAVPAATFGDADAGDRLRLSATLADGAPLPDWLYFDGPAGRFLGTPGAVGEWTVRVTARDLSGLAASDAFVIRVEPSPSRLLLGTAGSDTLEGALGNDTLAGGSGADILVGGGGNDSFRLSRDGAWPSAALVNLFTGRSIALGGRPASWDVLEGGEGIDTAVGTDADDVVALDDAINPNSRGDAPRLVSVERFDLGGGDDVLILASARWAYGDVSVSGGAGIDVVWSGAGQDTIDGGAGNDILDGGPGIDLLIGGPGNDIITAEPGDTVLEHPGEGVDTVRAYASLTLGPNLENLTLLGSAAIDGTGNALDNLLTGNAAPNVLAGGAGNDTYVVGPGDTVVERPDEGIDGIESPVTWTLPEGVERLLLTGTAPVDGHGNAASNRLTGNAAANLLAGGDGADNLLGGGGDDLLLGQASNDLLYGGAGRNVLDGGEGKDTLTGEGGNEFFLGGRGADRIVTGGGRDVVAFNAGDGQDTVLAGGSNATLSLGGGIAYADLWFRVSGSDLVLETGGTDRLTLAGWYGAAPVRGVDRLQLMVAAMGAWDAGSADPLVNRPVAAFDFAQLAARFDAARTADPSLSRWPAMTALLEAYRDGWDAAAVGGDLAWRYGREGTLAGIGKAGAGSVLADTGFGIGPQGLLGSTALAAGTPAWS